MLACFLRYHRILRGPGGNSEASAYIEHTLSNYGADECVAHAETKDHLNWESIGLAAKREKGDIGKALKKAYEEVEDEVYEHLYHYNKRDGVTGWLGGELVDRLGIGGDEGANSNTPTSLSQRRIR